MDKNINEAQEQCTIHSVSGSALIAEFMCVHETIGHYDSYGQQVPCYWTDNDLYRTPTFGSPDKSLKNFLDASEYQTSWAWLMPVIEKISISEYDDGEKMYPRTFGMQNEDTGQFMFRFNRQQLFEADTLIEAAYNAVISYLRGYQADR